MQLKPWPLNENYSVSTCGKIFRDGKERVLSLDSKGYYGCNLPVHGKYQTRKVHQMVLETFVGPKPEGMQTRHLNGIRTDNRLENLKWGTPQENTEDKISHGTVSHLIGESHPHARLTEAIVLELRRRAREGEETKELAKEFGMPEAAIRDAVNGRKWKHLPGAFKRKPGPKKRESRPTVESTALEAA